MPKKKGGSVGYGNPPSHTRFRAGKSGNPAGRPKGSKNLSTALEKELRDRVPITENGRQKRLSKGQVAIKQLVNRAAAGDPKALETIFKYTASRENRGTTSADALSVFDTPAHHQVIGDIVRRIRDMDEPPSDESPPPAKKGKRQ